MKYNAPMSGFTLVIGDKKKKSELPIAKNTVRFALIGVCFLVTSCSQTPSPKLITYNTPKGIQIQALYALPETSFGTSVPAIVYNHGRLIHGNDFKRSAQLGYDISHFVDRFAAEGYATIAPIRETSNSREQNEDMLEGVFQFLKNQKRIDTSKIGMVGFSLGGGPTFLAVTKGYNVRCAILISPKISKEDLTPESIQQIQALRNQK